MLLVYYGGHGFLDPDGGLYLGVANTDPAALETTALPASVLLSALGDSRASARVLILDCSFAGSAIRALDLGRSGTPWLSEGSKGVVILAAAGPHEHALAVSPGAPPRHTAFTGQLVRLLRDGIPDGPELLTLRVIFDELQRRMRNDGLPLPVYVSTNQVDRLALVRNLAWASDDELRPITPPPVAAGVRPSWLVPGFAPERPHGEDLLGVHGDASALAVLLGSRSLEPPLALALYGAWGSGKTFFMHQIEAEIERYCARESTHACRKVASVWFNAWQYAEADLQASLIHHLFASLYDRSSAAQQQMAAALERVEGAKLMRSQAEQAVADAEKRVGQALEHVSKLEEERRKAALEAKQLRLTDVLAEVQVDPAARDELSAQLQRLGWTELGTSARDLERAVGDARDLARSARALALAKPVWKSPLILGAGVLAAGTVATYLLWWATRQVHGLGFLAGTVGALASVAGGAATWITRLNAMADKVLAPARRVQQNIDARREEKDREHRVKIAKAAESAAEAERALSAARGELQAAQLQQTVATEAHAELTPGRLLARYLSDRASSADYDRYLGSVALTHRDLADLSSYLGSDAADTTGQVPDRIVLYIDDLDRCPPAMVSRVLEAVHLLLSLPLFVVVVGVDPQWLHASVRAGNPQLAEPWPNADAKQERADTTAYLDKIFQLTYHLPGMTADQCAGLMERTARDPTPAPNEPRVFSPNQRTPDVEGTQGIAASDERNLASTEPETSGPDIDVLGAQALELGDADMPLLRAVAPLVGTSPRQAKRFLNVYRIVKARALLDAVLCERLDAPGALGGLAALLALCVGLPSWGPSALQTAAESGTDSSLHTWLNEQRDSSRCTRREREKIAAFLANSALIHDQPMHEVVAWLPQARRFAWPADAGLDRSTRK